MEHIVSEHDLRACNIRYGGPDEPITTGNREAQTQIRKHVNSEKKHNGM